MLVLIVILEKVGKLKDEGNDRISWGGNYNKNEILEVSLNCLATASKSKWEKSMEKAKEGNWVLYTDSSRKEEVGVEEGWVSHNEKVQGRAGLGKLAIV